MTSRTTKWIFWTKSETGNYDFMSYYNDMQWINKQPNSRPGYINIVIVL